MGQDGLLLASVADYEQASLCLTISQTSTDRVSHDMAIFEPCHEIIELLVLHKLILQTHMLSHPVGLDI